MAVATEDSRRGPTQGTSTGSTLTAQPAAGSGSVAGGDCFAKSAGPGQGRAWAGGWPGEETWLDSPVTLVGRLGR